MKKIFTGISMTLILPGLFLLPSCSKDGGRCLTPAGRVITQVREVSGFDSIRVLDNINVILSPGSEPRVTVEAGENIIGGITTEIVGRELVLRNTNTCNWLRSYSSPHDVRVTATSLLKIHYDGSGNISCTDTIRSGYLKIDLWGGCGTIDLKINVTNGFFLQHMGTATMELSGICNVSSVFAGDYGLLRLDRLRTGYTFVTNSSSNDCYVNANHALDATITSIGNIYYSGDPGEIKYSITGSGRLIRQ
ncbi:MAG TPA: head GIN domain-containing protein [Bacteroidales bacterium]|nr:head GIN domain-containing protein [Bacteroidales bacterium]